MIRLFVVKAGVGDVKRGNRGGYDPYRDAKGRWAKKPDEPSLKPAPNEFIVVGPGGITTFWVHGEVSTHVAEKIRDIFVSMPTYARDGITSVHIHAGPGYGFEAGGQQFQAAGDYTPLGWNGEDPVGTINFFNASNLEWYATDSAVRMVAHEVGHHLWQRMVQMAWKQEEEKYGELVLSGAFYRSGGMKDVEVQHRLAPLSYLKDQHTALRQAQYGCITPYATAWNNDTECAAEAFSIYQRFGRDHFYTVAGQSENQKYAMVMAEWFEETKKEYDRTHDAHNY